MGAFWPTERDKMYIAQITASLPRSPDHRDTSREVPTDGKPMQRGVKAISLHEGCLCSFGGIEAKLDSRRLT